MNPRAVWLATAAIVLVLTIAGCVAAAFSRPARRPSRGPPPKIPGDPETWIELQSSGPLQVRRYRPPTWTTDAVRAVLAELAAQAGGILVGDVGPQIRGAYLPPHLSHRWGRDVDLSYTRRRWSGDSSTAREPIDPELLTALDAIAPYIERVGVSAARALEIGPRDFKVSIWPGHDGHMHVRLIRELASSLAV